MNLNIKKQKGFSILVIILVIVAIIVAIGIWALSGQSNNSNLSSANSDVEASNIISNANSIQSAYDALRIKGNEPTNIKFIPNSSNPNNILDPINGIAYPQVSPKALSATLESTEGYFVYNANHLQGANIGFSGSGSRTDGTDPAIILVGIKDSVCQSINKTLFNNKNIPKANSGIINNLLSSPGQINTGATISNPNSAQSLSLVTVPGLWNIEKACISVNPFDINNNTESTAKDHNMYIHILEAR